MNMLRLIKVCFWIAVVVMFLPEDGGNVNSKSSITAASAIELASTGIQDVGGFCARNPNACLQGKEAIASLSQKTIRTARSIYEYIQETSPLDTQNGLEQIFVKPGTLSIEEQIKLAQSTGQTLSVSDLNIDFSLAN